VVLYAANLAQFPLRRLLYQLEKLAGNAEKAEAIKNGGGKKCPMPQENIPCL
jgi:hypothetical protein